MKSIDDINRMVIYFAFICFYLMLPVVETGVGSYYFTQSFDIESGRYNRVISKVMEIKSPYSSGAIKRKILAVTPEVISYTIFYLIPSKLVEVPSFLIQIIAWFLWNGCWFSLFFTALTFGLIHYLVREYPRFIDQASDYLIKFLFIFQSVLIIYQIYYHLRIVSAYVKPFNGLEAEIVNAAILFTVLFLLLLSGFLIRAGKLSFSDDKSRLIFNGHTGIMIVMALMVFFVFFEAVSLELFKGLVPALPIFLFAIFLLIITSFQFSFFRNIGVIGFKGIVRGIDLTIISMQFAAIAGVGILSCELFILSPINP